jgi:cytochrome c oxidase subunit 3
MEAGSISVGRLRHEPAAEHEHEHHGPPPAHQSSRVEASFLGMLLFIISEVMLFGAFFTVYFFVRVVNAADWPAAGTSLPLLIAAVNTAILLSSSGTIHWALLSVRRENRAGMRAGLLTTFLLGLTFLTIQINEYVHLGFSPSDHAQGSIFYGLTGLHGFHVAVGLILLAMATTRAYRGHYSKEQHRGLEVPGIYWHFVDVMWVFVFTTVYVL